MLNNQPIELMLIRHGQTDWNAERRIQGQTGPGLNKLGRQQAQEAAQSLVDQGIDVIYSSDLHRAAETARIIADCLGGVKVIHDQRLRERGHGEWEGKTLEELDVLDPGWRRIWRGIQALDGLAPGGETARAVLMRTAPVLTEIAGNHSGQRVLIVTHGGVINVLRAYSSHLAHDADWGGTSNCELVPVIWPPQHTVEQWLGQ
jgi:probable phosphoglycerate mutase